MYVHPGVSAKDLYLKSGPDSGPGLLKRSEFPREKRRKLTTLRRIAMGYRVWITPGRRDRSSMESAVHLAATGDFLPRISAGDSRLLACFPGENQL